METEYHKWSIVPTNALPGLGSDYNDSPVFITKLIRLTRIRQNYSIRSMIFTRLDIFLFSLFLFRHRLLESPPSLELGRKQVRSP